MPKRKNETSYFHLSPFEEEIITIILGKELYSLDIARAYDDLVGGEVSIGSLYAALRKLERKKYIAARWGSDNVEERNGGRRRYYRVTDLGEKALYAVRKRREDLVERAAIWHPA